LGPNNKRRCRKKKAGRTFNPTKTKKKPALAGKNKNEREEIEVREGGGEKSAGGEDPPPGRGAVVRDQKSPLSSWIP